MCRSPQKGPRPHSHQSVTTKQNYHFFTLKFLQPKPHSYTSLYQLPGNFSKLPPEPLFRPGTVASPLLVSADDQYSFSTSGRRHRAFSLPTAHCDVNKTVQVQRSITYSQTVTTQTWNCSADPRALPHSACGRQLLLAYLSARPRWWGPTHCHQQGAPTIFRPMTSPAPSSLLAAD